jgi:hypothetical protein
MFAAAAGRCKEIVIIFYPRTHICICALSLLSFFSHMHPLVHIAPDTLSVSLPIRLCIAIVSAGPGVYSEYILLVLCKSIILRLAFYISG